MLATLSWWGRLLTMDHSRMCYRVYKFRREHIRENRISWCGVVKSQLQELKLEQYWMSEDIGELSSWRALIKSRIGAHESRAWRERLLEKPKLRLYRRVKSDLAFEQYLLDIPELKFRRIFAMMRGGTNQLRIETGRYVEEEVHERTCFVCGSDAVEDEGHVLIDCISYEVLRRRMFQDICYRTGDVYKLSQRREDKDWLVGLLLGNGVTEKGHRVIVKQAVARFFYRAMRSRTQWLGDL